MSNIIKVKDSNGNWIGIPALQGEPGITPHIGENGNWFIGEEDTGVKANIDLTPYATTEEVNQAINAIDIPANISDLTNDSGFITKAVDNLDNYYKKTEVDTAISEIKIPTKVSELTNDSGFLTNTVNNLTNYYKKSETYTQAEVNNLINSITTLNIEVVSALPTSNISSTTIYLKGSNTTGTNDYEEWIYVNGGWELIGTTAIDLTPYATKTYVGEQIAGVTKSSLGLGNVENKSSATIRGELTSANVTTALGYTPLKTAYTLPVATSSALGGIKSGMDITVDASGNVSINDNSHNHSAANITSGVLSAARIPDNYSYLNQYLKTNTSTEAEQYFKLFTVTPAANGYKDFHYTFEIVGRSKKLTKFYLTVATSNDNYLKNPIMEYEGSVTLGDNLKTFYFEDTTNATSRIEVWTKVTSWDVLSFYPKTMYNRNAMQVVWNVAVGTAFPTDATATITSTRRSWTGTAWTANTATSADSAKQVYMARSASTGYYPILLTNVGDGTTAKNDTVYAPKNNTVTMDPGAGKIKATGFVGSGAELTALNASNISSGTISSDRLPKASTSVIGGIKVGSGLSIDANGVLSAANGSGATSLLLSVATSAWAADTTYTGYGFKATVTATGVTANSILLVGLTNTATSAQEEASAAAGVQCKGQAANQIILYAKTKPTIALPISVTILG